MIADTGTELLADIAGALPPLVSSVDTIESNAVDVGMPAALNPLVSWELWRDRLDSFYHEDWHSLRIHLEVDLAAWPDLDSAALALNYRWVRGWYLDAMPCLYHAEQLHQGLWAGSGGREELEPHLKVYRDRFGRMQYLLWVWIGWLGRWRASVRARNAR